MTAEQKKRIAELRAENYPYSFIANALGVPMNTVKSICRRQSFPAHGPRKTKEEKQNAPLCKNCHMILPSGRSDRLFCSGKCRTQWWRKNRIISEIVP